MLPLLDVLDQILFILAGNDDTHKNLNESNRKAMNTIWSNQKANPALKTKAEINKYYK